MTRGQGSTRAWRRVRVEVLERDGYHCRLRYPGCRFEATEVDHVINLASTGTPRCEAVDPDECVAACGRCHHQKSAREAAEGARRGSGKRPPPRHPADVA
jgi:5-methylcytosine-specific restriction endonuclease McrA